MKYKKVPEELLKFMPQHQVKTIEKNPIEFQDAIENLLSNIKDLPKTYETDGQGNKAIAKLHYFAGSADWWITEQDQEEQQIQAFGLVRMHGEFELGYINIEELKTIVSMPLIELDFHWTPISLKEVKSK